MVIDKSWTRLGRHEKTFYTGLKKFIEDCKLLVDSAGNIKCPCKSCRLVLWVSIENLSRHITNYGFDPSYKTWIHHGEPDLPLPPPVIDNTRQPQMSDMTACLNDLSYIPLNNEQNEPTQGDIVEPRNVRLGLAVDGFNSFGNLSQSYSMWPVILTTYNLPPWLCMKESSFMLTLLIPGPKSLGKDIDVYLRPLIDDLKDLWAKPGVETIDVATGQKFNMRAMVLWTINDFPARSSLSGWSGQGYRACPTCNKDTQFVHVLGKTAYVGHKRSLKKPHKWRRSLKFNDETKNRDPPREFSWDAIMTQLARFPTRVKGKHLRFGGVKIKRNVLVELNWTKRSIFYELEYWSFLTLKNNLEVMHIKKNVLESILNTFLMNDKSKDTAKARQDLERLGIRSGLWLGKNKNGKCSKPEAAYSFTPEDKKKFCQFIKRVKLPDGFGSNFKHKVTDNDTNITGLKSHDCHIMMQHLLPYRLQQYLPSDIATLLIELCLFFKKMCSYTLIVDDMLKAVRISFYVTTLQNYHRLS
ncbi:zinc finger, PHD-type containing protein [Tanacetum coccineum]